MQSFATGVASDFRIDLDAARQQFQAAREICIDDAGLLWGVSLCGPIMFVDPQSRQVVTNQQDGDGVLNADRDVFRGLLPTSVNIANTPTHWGNVLWTQLIWPLPENSSIRNTLLAHELFHRIQTRVPIPAQREAANDHLDMLEGRFLLQLEWRALAASLRCISPAACRLAISDALLFRAARYQLFPNAAAEEKALELNEGIAEYTGVRLGNSGHESQLKAALYDLTAHVGDQTFVRSFAYATGPAYGLLLDKFMPNWKQQLQSGSSLSDLLRNAVDISTPSNARVSAKTRGSAYDGAALWTAEVLREKRRQQTLALNRARFVDGPVLLIPLRNPNIQFNPQNLQPLGEFGTVYPTMRISADWGVLEVQNGALLKPDWSAVSVAAPVITEVTPQGNGWTLALKPNWHVAPGERKGDFVLTGPPDIR